MFPLALTLTLLDPQTQNKGTNDTKQTLDYEGTHSPHTHPNKNKTKSRTRERLMSQSTWTSRGARHSLTWGISLGSSHSSFKFRLSGLTSINLNKISSLLYQKETKHDCEPYTFKNSSKQPNQVVIAKGEQINIFFPHILPSRHQQTLFMVMAELFLPCQGLSLARLEEKLALHTLMARDTKSYFYASMAP